MWSIPDDPLSDTSSQKKKGKEGIDLEKPYVVVSFSGGKDSTAMLLHMIELGEHIDEVINVDTGMEFPGIYAHISQIQKVIEDKGIKFTILKSDKTFEYFLMDIPQKKTDRLGWGWPAARIRWCTKYLKTELIKKYVPKDSIHCVGLAADEIVRIKRENNKHSRHPLVEWRWTESDALSYCKSLGYDFGGLYDKFDRMGCWICPLQSIDSLRVLWSDFPELWQKWKSMRMSSQTAGTTTDHIKDTESRIGLKGLHQKRKQKTNRRHSTHILEGIDFPGNWTEEYINKGCVYKTPKHIRYFEMGNALIVGLIS